RGIAVTMTPSPSAWEWSRRSIRARSGPSGRPQFAVRSRQTIILTSYSPWTFGATPRARLQHVIEASIALRGTKTIIVLHDVERKPSVVRLHLRARLAAWAIECALTVWAARLVVHTSEDLSRLGWLASRRAVIIPHYIDFQGAAAFA